MKRASEFPSQYDKCVERVNLEMKTHGIPCAINLKAFKECMPHIPRLIQDMRAAGHNVERETYQDCNRRKCHIVDGSTIYVHSPNKIPSKTCYY